MGKHKRHKRAAIPIQEHDHDHHQKRPLDWGILSVLNYHHWHWRVVKKRLNKNHDGHKHGATEAENPRDDGQASSVEDSSKDRKAEMANSKGEGKKRRSNPVPKHSVKSKLKALITEEMSKRKAKGKHRRSSTCPAAAELTRNDQNQHIDDSLPGKALNKERLKMAELNNAISSDSSSEHQTLLKSSENGEEYEPFLSGNDSSHDQVDEVERQLIENATVSQEGKRQSFLKYRSISSKDLKKHASEHQLKYYRDAVDMINMNKGFLLTILQDPGSPLAHHFHKQQSMRARMGMARLGTFPSPGSSSIQNQKQDQDQDQDQDQTGFVAKEKEPEAWFHFEKLPDHDSAEDICRKSMPVIAADHRADGIHQLNQTVLPDVASSPGSAHYLNQSEAKNRFKHLKEKIKHAIKESKKERHRIAMDAVLHKIPHNKGFSKDLTKDIVEYFPSRIRDVFDEPSIRKRRYHKRSASSFNESMDRYTQLYEANFSREAKEDISKRIEDRREEEDMVLPRRNAPKTLGRILSSPELHSYFYHSEDSFDGLSSDMPTTVADSTLSISSFNETKILDVSAPSDYHSELDTLAKNESEDNLICIREKSLVFPDQLASNFATNSMAIAKEGNTSEESENLMKGDNVSQSEQDSKLRIALITELEEPNPIPLLNLNFDMKATIPAEADLEIKKSHSLASGLDLLADVQHEFLDSPKIALKKGYLDNDLLQDGIDTHNKDKFTYVRDILELSGFCGNEALGKWYANDQPMDPLVYEEVKGCIFCDPNNSIVQEGGYCNHPLLFDLINEVLMELYERSYSYYPRPLSSFCHIHPMPVGHHVLEKVWTNINWYLSFETGYDKPLDYVASRDLQRGDGWMNLQFENECLGLEVEDLIFSDLFNDLLDELI